MSGRAALVGLLAVVQLGMGAPARALDASMRDGKASPDAVITELYELVSLEAGETPDWERVRSLFLPEAIIVLRTSRDSTTILTVDGFIDDFVGFIERSGVSKTGFKETIIRSHTLEYGNLAQVLVLFEAEIPGAGRAAQRGIDNIHLSKRDDGWRIVSITNEIVGADGKLPLELEE